MNLPRWPLLFLLLPAASARSEEAISNRPIDPAQLTRVRFGTQSHWLQPWRGYLETVPASRFLDGLGIVLTAYDPILGERTKVRSRTAKDGTVQLELTARDYPILLETE